MKKILYFSLTAMLILAVALSGCGGGGGNNPPGGGGGNNGGGVVTVTTVAGGGLDGKSSGDIVNITGSEALFNGPDGIAIANGIIYVSDSSNEKIKMIEPASDYRVTTIAGNGETGSNDNTTTGTAASFNDPKGIAIAANGNIYVVDMRNHKIRMISATSNHPVSTIAGTGVADNGTDNSIGTNATFNYPYGITLAADGIYVADGSNKVRKIGLESPFPVSSLIIGSSYALASPAGIAMAPDGIYVTTTSSSNSRILKLIPSTQLPGTYNSISLAGGGAGYADGLGANARFNQPIGIAIGTNGNMYVADCVNNCIRKFNSITGQVTTIAGGGSNGTTSGSIDGIGTAALFNRPRGIAIAADGSLYVADFGNNKIRRITFN